jgi:hypothetical protein
MPDIPDVTPAEYALDDGGTIIIEAEVPRGYQEQQVSFLRRAKDQTPKLGDAVDHVLPAVREVANRIRDLELRPDEIQLEVGVKFVGEAGVVIARASAEANLVIKLKWLTGAPTKPSGAAS